MKKSREQVAVLCVICGRMRRGWNFFWVLMMVGAMTGCVSPPPPVVDAPTPSRDVYRAAAKRFAAIVVSEKDDVDGWLGSKFSQSDAPKNADGGSAIPITHDGYFLTADHVLARSPGRKVVVILRREGRLRATPARVVWRSADDDLALLHAPIATPEFYRWSPPSVWLPQGTPIMHAGIATGFKSPSGRLLSPIHPESALSGNQRFKHDIPLEPGDSGGAVVDSKGNLVGVNSAVEFLVPLETAFFIESEANRPNVGRLMRRIETDRRTSVTASL